MNNSIDNDKMIFYKYRLFKVILIYLIDYIFQASNLIIILVVAGVGCCMVASIRVSVSVNNYNFNTMLFKSSFNDHDSF